MSHFAGPGGSEIVAALVLIDPPGLAIGDQERERLILAHLPQVRLIARRIQERLPENIVLEDLVSTGVLGFTFYDTQFAGGSDRPVSLSR